MITFNRTDLITKLERMRAGVSSKPILEQSSSVVFDKGMLITYNDEVSCRIKSGLPEDFVCAVLYKPLIEVLTKLQEDTLEVSLSDTEFTVHGKNRKAGVFMEKEIQLGYKAVEKPEEWVALPDDFSEAVSVVSAVAGKDESKLVTTCVNFSEKGVEATDNIQIVRYRIKCGFKNRSMIRKEGAKVIAGLDVTHFSETPTWLHFKCSNKMIYSVKRYMDEFVDIDPMLQDEGPEVKLPKSLVEAAERARIFSSENADEDLVTIKIKEGKVQIEGKGSSGWYKEVKKADYKGEPLSFMISPVILMDLLKRLNRCRIASNRLLVDGGKWKYATVLSIPE